MLIVSRGATAEWPMRKDDTHNSRLLGSMIGPKPFCESVGPQLNYFTICIFICLILHIILYICLYYIYIGFESLVGSEHVVAW